MVAAPMGAVLMVSAGVLWLRTGKSPFLLAALALLFLEAVRAEMFASSLPAARILARRIGRRFAAVRAEIGAEA